MKRIIYIILLLVMINIVTGLDECKGTMNDDEIPCWVLLPVNTSDTACNTIKVRFFNTTTNLYNATMDVYSDFFCNATFNRSEYGTYVFHYSTGDTGSIIIQENKNNRIWLFVIALVVAIVLIVMGFYLEDGIFVTVGGMMLCIVALDLYVNGFPNLNNDFLRNTISIILTGIGFIFIIMPWISYFEEIA